MTSTTCLIMLAFLLSIIKDSQQGQHERKLFRHLFERKTYNKYERPSEEESEPVNVKFAIILQQIIDVDEKNQIIQTSIWLQMEWNAYNLRWDPEEFDNLTTIIIPRKLVWVPDILMYNSASEDFDNTYQTNVVLTHNGDCLWVPPGMFRSTCSIDITWFPFDDQHCDLKFGSWTYEGSLLNLTHKSDSGDLSSFIRNGEWVLIEVPVERHIKSYDCCPEFYIDLTYTIHIRRRTLYYGFNIIIPCVLISSLTLLLFVLPPDAGEKISLGVTILLSLMVFLLLVAETMPPTSDAVPLIGIYFACIMVMCSLSILFTVIVLNFHNRTPNTHTMPPWVKRILCGRLAAILRMKRPVNGNPWRAGVHEVQGDKGDDRHRLPNGNTACFLKKTEEGMSLMTASMRNDVMCILHELKKITNRCRKEDEENDTKSDWKFAAMVMDRLCLIICCIFTLGSTIAIMVSAPHILV